MEYIMEKAVQFYRAAQIHKSAHANGLIPVSKSLWHRWVAEGYAPQPIKVGRVSLWLADDIHQFARRLAGCGDDC